MELQNNEIKIPKRVLNTLISALTAGVVPRLGAPYIAIGRQDEINSLLDNLDTAASGGAFCRFLIGRYGSGKSFLIQLIRGKALDSGFICADADLSPERRLCAGNGAGLATYRELMINLATKASPDGGALPVILSRYYAQLKTELAEQGIMPEDADYSQKLMGRVARTLSEIEGDVGGFDFARVLSEYFAALTSENSERKSACLKWLRGEFSNKTEANSALGFRVSTVIDDDNWYNYVKLISSLSVKLGYSGLIVFIDECVNLYKIPNRISREANYEKFLAIFNDTLQGKASYLGFIFGGTPQFLEDPRRGLFSYDALKSRLADSKYAAFGYQNLSSPVIRLRMLSDNELMALVKRLVRLYEMREGTLTGITDKQLEAFLRSERGRAGAEELITPREIIRDFLTVLNILKDNKTADFDSIVSRMAATAEHSVEGEAPREGGVDTKKISLFDIDI